MCFKFCMVLLYLQFLPIEPVKILDPALAQWQNMAICEYKKVKIVKIEHLQRFTP